MRSLNGLNCASVIEYATVRLCSERRIETDDWFGTLGEENFAFDDVDHVVVYRSLRFRVIIILVIIVIIVFIAIVIVVVLNFGWLWMLFLCTVQECGRVFDDVFQSKCLLDGFLPDRGVSRWRGAEVQGIPAASRRQWRCERWRPRRSIILLAPCSFGRDR